MSVAIVASMLGAVGPESRNGSTPSDEGPSYGALARNVAVVALPVLLAGAAAVAARRRQAGQTQGEQGGARPLAFATRKAGNLAPAKAKRYRPKNLVRYYGLGVVISTLERDSTRKAIIATLKWMQKRS